MRKDKILSELPTIEAQLFLFMNKSIRFYKFSSKIMLFFSISMSVDLWLVKNGEVFAKVYQDSLDFLEKMI